MRKSEGLNDEPLQSAEVSRTVALLDDFFMKMAEKYPDEADIMRDTVLTLRLHKVNRLTQRFYPVTGKHLVDGTQEDYERLMENIRNSYPKDSGEGVIIFVRGYSDYDREWPGVVGLEGGIARDPSDRFAIELARELGVHNNENTGFTETTLQTHPQWRDHNHSLPGAPTNLGDDIRFYLLPRFDNAHETAILIQEAAFRDFLLIPHPPIPFDLSDSKVGEWFRPILERERDIFSTATWPVVEHDHTTFSSGY